MKLTISQDVLQRIWAHGEAAYPEEGAGLLLGRAADETRTVVSILPLTNAREDAARHNRYMITPQEMLKGELEAEKLGLDVLGVFHSHPDHPNQPSEFDRQWALPWFSYVITSVVGGQAQASRSWRLTDDRQQFLEEQIVVGELEEEAS